MKRIIYALLISISLGWTAPLDKIIAVVGDEIILQSEINEMIAAYQQQGRSFQSASPEEVQKMLLKNLIDEKVMITIANRDTTIILTDEEVERTVKDQVSRMSTQNGGETQFEALLKEHMGMDLQGYKEAMRSQMRTNLLTQKLRYKYIGNTEATGLEVKEFYKKYKDSIPPLNNNFKISHFEYGIKANRENDKKAYRLCDSLIRLLNDGSKFEDLAKAYSDDPTGSEGGDLGFNKRGTLDPVYERVAFRLGSEQYSRKPVRSHFGYHIIKVTERKDIEVRTSHILIMVTPTAEDTSKTIATLDSLKKEALKKHNFSEIAKKLSEDKATRKEGGDLGWFTLESIDPAYKEIVEGLAQGEISSPTLIDGKYHLLYVEKKLDQRKITLEEDYNRIASIAKNQLISKKLEKHLARWKKEVHIENRLSTATIKPSIGPSLPVSK